PERPQDVGSLLAHLVRQIGDLDRLVDANALLFVAHRDGGNAGSTQRLATSPQRLLAPALRLRLLFTLLALRGAALLLFFGRVGDDHLLAPFGRRQLDEALDVGPGPFGLDADDDPVFVANDAATVGSGDFLAFDGEVLRARSLGSGCRGGRWTRGL